jgi:pantothenate kinase
MANDENAYMEAMYDQAADIAGKHLNAALDEGGPLEYLVAVMMVEASVNAAVEATSREDIIRLLKDLIEQIESDEAEED